MNASKALKTACPGVSGSRRNSVMLCGLVIVKRGRRKLCSIILSHSLRESGLLGAIFTSFVSLLSLMGRNELVLKMLSANREVYAVAVF